jgi:tRNA (guanine37-N1)-methyltransferase
MIYFDILTIFPKIFDGFLKESFIKKAIEKKKIKIRVWNLRAFAKGKRKVVDDKPYGGGLGMVLKIEPIFLALKKIAKIKIEGGSCKFKKGQKIIFFTPRGKIFNQRLATFLSKQKQIVFICGRYEGVDERVAKYLSNMKISLGNFDLMGGEVPAMAVIETVTRLIPGVIGKEEFLKERKTKQGFVEFPQYTRPAVFSPKKGVFWKVPKVLLSGDHKKIQEWREQRKKILEK